MKKVKDFMNKKVVSFKPEDSIFDVAQTFAKLGISGAPVVSRGKVIGVVSETDVVKFMSMKLSNTLNSKSLPLQSLSMICLNLIRAGKSHLAIKKDLERISKTKVKNVMTKEAVSVSPDTNVFDAAAIMERHDVNRLPVVSSGKLIGIVARADLIKALVD
jgi:CBS domain-containing protein